MFCCHFVPPQIQHGLAWDNTRATVVRGHHLVTYTVVMAHHRIMLLPMVGDFEEVQGTGGGHHQYKIDPMFGESHSDGSKLKWGTQICIDIMVLFLPLLQKEGRLNGEWCEGSMYQRKSAPFYLQREKLLPVACRLELFTCCYSVC